ncbi:MAG: enoyl-CoA hydratase-related protein [Acidimicrobiia bacterium]|nr:enoyl-CoA hydratase-related protein [Acidimicrobiia bacterium]
MPRLVGYQKAKEVVMSGRQVGASEALELGLADKVAPDDELLELAMEDAASWASRAPLALAEAKRLFRETGVSGDFDADMAREAAAFQRLFVTSDGREGVAAFVEKREAHFTGQ